MHKQEGTKPKFTPITSHDSAIFLSNWLHSAAQSTSSIEFHSISEVPTPPSMLSADHFKPNHTNLLSYSNGTALFLNMPK